MSAAVVVTACDNHTCNQPAADDALACPLCKEVAYCSEKCRHMDWQVHDCPNAVHVESRADRIMVPYHYEDTLPENVVQELGLRHPVFESYAVVHHGTDQQVTQYVQAPLLYAPVITDAAAVAPVPVDTPYTLCVAAAHDPDRQRFTVMGSALKDTIYADNKYNKMAARQADANVPSVGTLYWSDKVAPAARKMTLPLEGALVLTLTRDGGEKEPPVTISGHYDLHSHPGHSAERLGKEVSKSLERRLRHKFKDASASELKGLRVVQASDDTGLHRAAVAFSVDPTQDEARVVDVEWRAVDAAQPQPQPVAETVDYHCDPKCVEDLVGLTMALERHIHSGEVQTTDTLENVAGIIRSHTRAILDGKRDIADPVPMDVSTAIYTATGELYDMDHLEGPARWIGDKWALAKYKRSLKKMDSEQLVQEFQDILVAARSDQSYGGTGGMFIQQGNLVVAEAKRRVPRIILPDQLEFFQLREARLDARANKKKERVRRFGRRWTGKGADSASGSVYNVEDWE